MSTPFKNFAKGTLSLGYNNSATSIVVATGHGSKFSSVFPYPCIWWNSTDHPDPADDPDAEIVLTTNRSGDTFTVVRAQEGTAATNKNITGKTYKLIQTLTAAVMEELTLFSPSQTFRGLTLTLHPNHDIAHKTVCLLHADSITMNDGQEISDWDDLSADITVSGANGLDTSTESINAWYEVHAIRNPVSEVKGLLLHIHRNYFYETESLNGEDASQGLRSAVDNSTVRIGQSFSVASGGPLEFIDVKVVATGAPTGQFWLQIEGNNAGVPNNTVLATSDKLDVSRIGTTATWVRMRFRTPVSISAATTYHMTMLGNYTVSATNFISWRMDGSAGTYTPGSKSLFDSDTSTWTLDTDDDMQFSLATLQNTASVTLPSGYTQSAHIGFVRNDSSGNFQHFFQRDRVVHCGYDDSWQITALTSTTPALVETDNYLPNVPVGLTLDLYNGSACSVAVGNLNCTDLTTTVTDERKGMERAVLAAGSNEHLGSIQLDRYAGFMAATSAGTLNMYVSSFTW